MTSDRLSFQFTRILGLNQKSMTIQEVEGRKQKENSINKFRVLLPSSRVKSRILGFRRSVSHTEVALFNGGQIFFLLLLFFEKLSVGLLLAFLIHRLLKRFASAN